MDKQFAWIKAGRKKCRRFLVVAVCVSLLMTNYPDIPAAMSVSAAEEQDAGESRIYGFEELAENIREQYVPVGTELEELTLPDELKAFAEETGENADSGADDGEDSPEGGNGEGNGENGEDNKEQDDKETDDGGESSGTEEGQDTRTEESEEGTETEKTDAEEDTGNNDTDSDGKVCIPMNRKRQPLHRKPIP